MRLGTWKHAEVDVFWKCPDEDFQLIGRISTPQMEFHRYKDGQWLAFNRHLLSLHSHC